MRFDEEKQKLVSPSLRLSLTSAPLSIRYKGSRGIQVVPGDAVYYATSEDGATFSKSALSWDDLASKEGERLLMVQSRQQEESLPFLPLPPPST